MSLLSPPNEAPNELECSYHSLSQRARRWLKARLDVEVLPVSAPDYPGKAPEKTSGKKRRTRAACRAEEIRLSQRWREVWRVNLPDVDRESECFDILVAIPWAFPDVLPKIYLPHCEASRVGIIPHLGADRFLCTFDEADIINDLECEPGALVDYVLQRAQDILQRGVGSSHGVNAVAFNEEFAAYWGQESAALALSLVEVGDEPKEIFLCEAKSILGMSRVFGDSKAQIRGWAKALGKGAGTAYPALYLPLPSLGNPPFGATVREFLRRLETTAPSEKQCAENFLARSPRPATILFGVQTGQNGKRTLGAWQHNAREISGFRSSQKSAASAPIRSKILSTNRELNGPLADHDLLKIAVERADVQRLHARVDAKQRVLFAGRVNVIGCGALGSQLAHLLARCGAVESLHLFDPQTLSIENVLRHQCPMTRVGQNKAFALAGEIKRHFPHIACQNTGANIIEVLRQQENVLQGAALTLVAVGDLGTERRLNRLALSNPSQFDHPLCFVGIEPLALGGNAWWQQPGASGCFECAFDSDFKYKPRIVNDAAQFSRREAGCQTTHVPYGGTDLATLVAALSRFILQAPEISSQHNANLLWNWCGDLTLASEKNISLHNPLALHSYQSQVQINPWSQGCRLCH